MDTKTLEALKASIAKWERNVQATTPEEVKTGPAECPLCKLFHGKLCNGCPVKEKVEYGFCVRTPYGDAERAADAWLRRPEAQPFFQKKAQDEVDFLKSLLPQEA